ncbi:ALBINO3-like protein 1, chloroplastic isoform X2 [Magnolia sinica]|uniref:ALBINO3-like protein 1, chloroplastic isoform X2 n=1 Tax=Magnolia sinica TaxID=86752 RepID=UPI002659D475|nr:ALBINO3-like protein 1, chloroplastic isoform X2 [Magnolia sinica]
MPTSLLSYRPLLFSPLRPWITLQHHRNHYGFFKQRLPLVGSSHVVRIGRNPESVGDLIGELFGRAQGLVYTTIADVADASSDSSSNLAKSNLDWLSGITNYLETVLKVESAMAMRSLQPQIRAIQQRYAGDQEKIQLETARLYKLAGVNPLAGCLPTLATIPIWIGLYRALSNVADEGLLMEGFFWIPSLSGPTTIAARQSGSGISWLLPFVDDHPPLGWLDTFAYLVLPVLLVVSQYVSIQIMQSSQGNDPNQKGSQALTRFLPLMIGYFALSVPSGLSLYWLTNNILSTGQQIWLQKLGGAKNPVRKYSEGTITEQPQMQKPAIDIDANILEPNQREKSTSGGLRPGERFKQIKEQEARRRQQREPEKRKAEEAAKGGDVRNVEHKQESEFLKIKDSTEAGFVAVEDENIVQTVTFIHDSTDPGAPLVNASQSTQDSKEDRSGIGVPEVRNGGATCNGSIGMKDEQNSQENL